MTGYGLIGEHLSHSLSPSIHSALCGLNYQLVELSSGELGPFMRRRDFRGINVTIPYKKDVIPYLDWISPDARSIGAVNTVVNRDGKLLGYNTDAEGFGYMARSAGVDFRGRKVLIIGRGGAAAAAARHISSVGGAELVFAVRRTLDLCRPGEELPLDCPELYAGADILVNCSPSGMYPRVDQSPLDLSAFSHLSAVIDCVYNPLRTSLLLQAAQMGIPCCGGLPMLVEQARLADELFVGKTIPQHLTPVLVRDIELENCNLVLCGFPSSGKTTVGRMLARKTGREFTDTDEIVEKRCSMSIERIFELRGEDYFRSVEREVIRELSLSGGKVISLGGGAVLDSSNVRLLKMNGRLIRLERSLDKIEPGEGRPLMRDRDSILRLAAERATVYNAVSEFSVRNDSAIGDAVDSIISLVRGGGLFFHPAGG